MMLANPQKSAILGGVVVVPEGLPTACRIKLLTLANHPKSRTGMRPVPLVLANLLAPAPVAGNEGRTTTIYGGSHG